MCSNLFRLLLLAGLLIPLHAASNVAANIFDKTVDSFFKEERVSAWGETPEHLQIIQNSQRMVLTKDPANARFLIVARKIPAGIAKDSVVMTTEYLLLEKDKRVVGAFFWQKGRPNLLFLRQRLREADLTLTPEFQKYIEDEQ